MKNNDKLTKMFVCFLVYFAYTMYSASVFKILGITNDILVSFIGDILFGIFIIFMYRKNLKNDLKKLRKVKFKNVLLTVVKWVIIVFVFVLLCGFITDLILPNQSTDANTEAIYSLYSVSTLYTIFKTMIFGTIIEEILYREALRENIKNKLLFILTASLIYTILNAIFVGFTNGFNILSLLISFLPSIIWSIAYLRINSNIILLSIIKFVYNLIPLAILLLGI